MLRGSWRYLLTIGLAGLVALGLAGLIYREASTSEAFYDHQADEAAQAARDSAAPHIERACVGVPPSARPECEADEQDAARERERQERDLQAQLVTSAWTRAMGLAALIATVASIIGVGLIWTTFRETRRQVQIAQDNLDIYYESERATLHAVDGETCTVGDRPEEFVAILFENKGRSAARIIELGGNGPPGFNGLNAAPRWTVIPAGKAEHVAAFPVPARNAILKVDCWAKYRSVGPKIHTSYFTVTVQWFAADSPHIISIPRWIVDVSNNQGHPDDT